METLAYFHLALAHQAPIPATPVLFLKKGKLFEWSRGKKLASHAKILWLSLLVILSIFGMAREVLAQTLLKRGTSGSEVTQLQRRLQELRYFNQQPTGFFGTITENSVKAFQRDSRLQADGVVGPVTKARLFPNSRFTPVPNSRFTPVLTNQSQTSSILRRGSRGAQVTQLQQRLGILGYFDVQPTGVFGSVTEDAVRAFQEDYRLQADGVVGARTQATLLTAEADASVARRITSQSFNILPSPANFSATNEVEFGTPLREPLPREVDVLRRGDRTPAVKRLQRELRTKGFDPGPVDGNYGAQTEEAVWDFQRNNNLVPSGIADRETLSALGLDTIGKSPKNRYVVVVPVENNNTLSEVRSKTGSENATQVKSRRGEYVNAGSFDNRQSAESLSHQLRASGLDARVEYLR